jgi:hypothetical protein
MGRTGSTVLGRVLGALPGVTFAGELSFFWRRFANAELCSCGVAIPTCPFWSDVVSEARGATSAEQATELAQVERQIIRGQLLHGRVPSRETMQTREVLDGRAQLYRAIAEVAQTPSVVDTGKELAYCIVMARRAAVDFTPIHLVRDPRGVAFSWLKRVRSDSEPGDMDRRSAASTAAHWLWQNLFLQASLQSRGGNYVRVRYEDLVTRLPNVLSAISSASGLGIPSPGELPALLATAPADQHLVAGNPGVRAQRQGGLTLRLDEEWMARLPRAKRMAVTAMCAGLMTPYGYRLRMVGRSAANGQSELHGQSASHGRFLSRGRSLSPADHNE